MTKEQIDALLERVRNWPAEDQEELAEHARNIGARRIGHFRATPEELKAIEDAEASGIASDKEVETAFSTFRSA